MKTRNVMKPALAPQCDRWTDNCTNKLVDFFHTPTTSFQRRTIGEKKVHRRRKTDTTFTTSEPPNKNPLNHSLAPYLFFPALSASPSREPARKNDRVVLLIPGLPFSTFFHVRHPEIKVPRSALNGDNLHSPLKIRILIVGSIVIAWPSLRGMIWHLDQMIQNGIDRRFGKDRQVFILDRIGISSAETKRDLKTGAFSGFVTQPTTSDVRLRIVTVHRDRHTAGQLDAVTYLLVQPAVARRMGKGGGGQQSEIPGQKIIIKRPSLTRVHQSINLITSRF
ncbi:hypothetical protein CDAR_18631 [Caerostris darwini]|uniref:Ribosomal protein S3 n=1 Tax=Caerostris darwini TaxID=1538125 RepID=A0AAV4V9N9_9ARAC|nr:hypothetical protein CDAR_18631 [Caerostris darwini]